jgi:cystathionine gamma-synthase
MQLAISRNCGRNQASSALSTFALSPWQMEERYRALIQMQSYLGSFFERASPAYYQSQTVWWFDPSYYKSDALNYDRKYYIIS